MASLFENIGVDFPHFTQFLSFATVKVESCNRLLADKKRRLLFRPVDAFDFDKLLARRQIDNTVIVTSNQVVGDRIDPGRYQEIGPDWYGIYHGAEHIDPTTPVKKFNCFINRMDPIRQSWLYLLVRRGIFDQGLVSFNMDLSRHIADGYCNQDANAINVFEQQFQRHMPNFAAEHEFVKNIVPFKNFHSSLRQTIMQTEFSLVLETYFDRNENISLTEKIFRCLTLPRPWLLFAVRHAVAHLRHAGFDVLDDLVDHGYDNIDFEIDRQTALLDQAELLCQRTLTDSQIQRCEQAALHNQLLLEKMHRNFNQAIELACMQAMNKCLALG
jgi:hypothetical protein